MMKEITKSYYYTNRLYHLWSAVVNHRLWVDGLLPEMSGGSIRTT